MVKLEKLKVGNVYQPTSQGNYFDTSKGPLTIIKINRHHIHYKREHMQRILTISKSQYHPKMFIDLNNPLYKAVNP